MAMDEEVEETDDVLIVVMVGKVSMYCGHVLDCGGQTLSFETYNGTEVTIPRLSTPHILLCGVADADWDQIKDAYPGALILGDDEDDD